MKNDYLQLISILISNSLFLEEDKKYKVCKVMYGKVQTHNAATYYQLSRLFRIQNLKKQRLFISSVAFLL